MASECQLRPGGSYLPCFNSLKLAPALTLRDRAAAVPAVPKRRAKKYQEDLRHVAYVHVELKTVHVEQ